jgi:hypothetical protein
MLDASYLRTPPSFAGDDPQLPALFLLRPESREAPFLAEHAADLDGAVLLARHLAPYPPDSSQRAEGLRGDELAREARRSKIPHLYDPDTAAFPMLRGDGLDAAFGRLDLTAAARSVPPRVSPADLEEKHALRDLVVAVLAPQTSVVSRAAPYFRFSALDDPWLEVNLRAARMTQELTRGTALATFVQVDLDGLLAGALAHAAARYANALSPRGMALLQVAGLDPEHADETELAAFLDAVSVWRQNGFNVIADRVGPFGVGAVAIGASGLACGTRVYRSTPDIQIEPPPFLRAGKLRYWAPTRHDRLPLKDAWARRDRGSLAPCPVEDCDALAESASLDDVRWHNIHLTLHELDSAGSDPSAFIAELLASPINYPRRWGQALEMVMRRRAHA